MDLTIKQKNIIKFLQRSSNNYIEKVDELSCASCGMSSAFVSRFEKSDVDFLEEKKLLKKSSEQSVVVWKLTNIGEDFAI